ncbi:MAG: hypothetical protein Q4C76_04395 [Bacillota bacterium]|nr:hypothetical protein [Bacillota bacterium]
MNMKKMLSLILALMLALCLCACGGGDTSTDAETEEETTGQEAETPETDEAEEPEASEGLEEGDEGDGPAELQAGLIDVMIPEGMSYKVDANYVNEGSPATGSVRFNLYKTDGAMIGKLIATTQNMVGSMEEAVQNTIDLCNLDTYSNGASYEMGDTMTLGGLTYQTLSTTTEFGTNYYCVTYVTRGDSDSDGLKIELSLLDEVMTPDDPMVAELLNALSVVMAE